MLNLPDECVSTKLRVAVNRVFLFSNPILYAALHNCVLSTLWQCLPQLLTIIYVVKYTYIMKNLTHFRKTVETGVDPRLQMW